MTRYSFLFLLFTTFLNIDGFCQRPLPGYTISNAGSDTVFGEFTRPTFPSADNPTFEQLFLSGQKYEQATIEDRQLLLQRLCGESVRLYRSLDLSNPTFYLAGHEGLSALSDKRLNVELAKHFAACTGLSNAMAYTKVKYKARPLVELINQYAVCTDVPNPKWTRTDSVEFNLSFDFFGGVSTVQDQPFKDHSGEFSNINFQGWGITFTAFSDRRIRLATGVKVYDMSTTNPSANVTPFSDPGFSSLVQYNWSSYEIPLMVAYNFHLSNWRGYAGIGAAITITDNLRVSELFSAPYLSSPEEVRAQLITNEHFGIGVVVGIERKLAPSWIIGLQYELQRSQMDFNLVRINRNPEQQLPIITTYRVATPTLFASPTDLTKFRFITSRLSISLKFRAFHRYHTFN